MSAPLAAVADLEIRLREAPGSLAGEDLAYAVACLEDASALVRGVTDREWLNESGAVVVPSALRTVALRAALRAFRNPDGVAGENFGTYSYMLPRGETRLGLTDAEVKTCRTVVEAVDLDEEARVFRGSLPIASAYDGEEML